MEISEKRCWKGYKRVSGKQPYSKGSCVRESYKLIGKVLFETNIFKQARRHLMNMKSGAFSHSTQRGDSASKGLYGILNTGKVLPGQRNLHGKASYWSKGKPDKTYGDVGITTKNAESLAPLAHFKPEGSMRSSVDYKHYLDTSLDGRNLQRKDTAFGVDPEDTELTKLARSKGLRVVSKPASDAAEKALMTKSPIDYKELMKTHRRNRKKARRLKKSINSLVPQNEESLHSWFKNSRSTSGKPGWVQVVSGKPCARQAGQKSTPKCVSSSKRASMTPQERKSAQARKRRMDPNQPQKSGAAKPTYVPTDKPKRK